MKRLAAVVLMLVLVAAPSLGGHPHIVDRELFGAAYRGDLGADEALPDAGADVNAFGNRVPGCCQDRHTALHQAVRYMMVFADGDEHRLESRTWIIEVLIASGADVKARDKLAGFSSLDAAERRDYTGAVDILVRAGADPGAP